MSGVVEGWDLADVAHASEAERGSARVVVEAAWVTVEVDTKDAEVRSVMDKIADEEKLSEALGLGLKKLQAESGASEVLVSMNVERLKGVTGNLALANKTAGASAEQHVKKMRSLQKAYGVVQTLIQFVKRAFERQASGKVHPAPGAAPQAGEVGHVALDTTNPKEVGIRGALDAASPDRAAGGDGVHGLESAVQFEKDLAFSETTTSPPEVATETGDPRLRDLGPRLPLVLEALPRRVLPGERGPAEVTPVRIR